MWHMALLSLCQPPAVQIFCKLKENITHMAPLYKHGLNPLQCKIKISCEHD